MLIYILQGRGVFGASSEETLPASVRVMCAEEIKEVRLNGNVLPVRGESFVLPDTLKDGVHEIKINGRACESVAVKRGKVRPAGEDFRRMLPAIYRIYGLELRLCALEEKAQEKQIDWLK